jgi:hypothetical protein
MTTDDIARAATLLNDLEHNHRAIGREETIYSRAIFEIEWLQGFVQTLARKLHPRKCHDCGHVGWYADGVLPYCICDKCQSHDTRRVN